MSKTTTKKAFAGRKEATKYSWNPYTGGITQTGISLFLACREQFRLKYVEGWSSKGSSAALDFGSLVHDCMEHLPHDASTAKIESHINNYQRKRLRALSGLTKDDRELQRLVGAKAKALVPEYMVYWEHNNAKIHWVGREQKFAVRHRWNTGPSFSNSPGDFVTLMGKWDGFFREVPHTKPQRGSDPPATIKDPSTYPLWLFETKTKSRIDEEGITDWLPHDIQIHLYCHALALHLGEEPQGVLYNVLRTPGLQFRVADTEAEYIARVRDDIQKRPEYYFLRRRVQFLPGDVERFAKLQLTPILAELVFWYENLKGFLQANPGSNPFECFCHFMNPNALFTVYGRCEFFDFITRNRHTHYYRRPVPHPELED